MSGEVVVVRKASFRKWRRLSKIGGKSYNGSSVNGGRQSRLSPDVFINVYFFERGYTLRTKNEIQAARRKAEETITRVQQELAGLEARRDAANGRLNALPSEGKLRTQRQELLAAGQEAGAITKELDKVRNLSEIIQDELAGLGRLIAQKQAAILGAEEEIQHLALEEALVEGKALVDEYNRGAAALAKTLMKMHRHQNSYSAAGGQGYYYTSAAPNDSAVERIPKVYLAGEQIPAEHSEKMFWDKGCVSMFMEDYSQTINR